jgi:Flp pilus assembly pilin Flp
LKRLLQRLWREDDGVLSIEWVLLVTLLVIGIVVGVSAARDAVVDELGDAAEAAVTLDQSYVIPLPLAPSFTEGANSGTLLPSPSIVSGIGPIPGSNGAEYTDRAVAYDVSGRSVTHAPAGQQDEVDMD